MTWQAKTWEGMKVLGVRRWE